MVSMQYVDLQQRANLYSICSGIAHNSELSPKEYTEGCPVY